MKTLVIAAGALALASTAALADPGVNWARVDETHSGPTQSIQSHGRSSVVVMSERREVATTGSVTAAAPRHAANRDDHLGHPAQLGWRN